MANRTMLSEARAFGEWMQLQVDPAFHGHNLPRGDGKPVIVLPGLFANDLYLQPLQGWLRRMGYKPTGSSLLINAGCPQRLVSKLTQKVNSQLQDHPGPIAIVGHSRGGMLGKVLTQRLRQTTSHFVALGSPLGALHQWLTANTASTTDNTRTTGGAANIANSATVNAAQAAIRMFDPDCDSPNCGCDYFTELQQDFPAATLVTSIYSSEDPVVEPSACPIPGAHNIEVTGSHAGLVANAVVYRHLAAALHTPPAN